MNNINGQAPDGVCACIEMISKKKLSMYVVRNRHPSSLTLTVAGYSKYVQCQTIIYYIYDIVLMAYGILT